MRAPAVRRGSSVSLHLLALGANAGNLASQADPRQDCVEPVLRQHQLGGWRVPRRLSRDCQGVCPTPGHRTTIGGRAARHHESLIGLWRGLSSKSAAVRHRRSA